MRQSSSHALKTTALPPPASQMQLTELCKCPVCGSYQRTIPEIVIADDFNIYLRGEKMIGLAASSRRIFAMLYKRMNNVVTKEQIYDELYWSRADHGEVEIKIVDVFMCRIRKFIRTQLPDLIELESVWGRGAMMKRVKK